MNVSSSSLIVIADWASVGDMTIYILVVHSVGEMVATGKFRVMGASVTVYGG